MPEIWQSISTMVSTYHLSYLSFNCFPLTIFMFRWALVLALLVTILVGVIIVLCLRKRKLAMRMNSQVSQVSQEEQRKTKDLEQSYSLIGERWDPCFWFNNSIYISKQQNLCTWILFCKVFSGKVEWYHIMNKIFIMRGLDIRFGTDSPVTSLWMKGCPEREGVQNTSP